MHDSLPWAKRITTAGARIFRGNRWGEILGKLPFRCLKPAFFGENVGESQFYPVLKPWPTAAVPATEKALCVSIQGESLAIAPPLSSRCGLSPFLLSARRAVPASSFTLFGHPSDRCPHIPWPRFTRQTFVFGIVLGCAQDSRSLPPS